MAKTLLTGEKKKWHWIDDDRIPSQAEIDYYAALDEGKDPVITQAHLDEIGVTEVTAEELAEPKTEEEIAEDNAPENQPAENDPNFTSEHNPYIDPDTGEKKFQTRKEWSASIGDDAISVGPTDTTSNLLGGGGTGAASKSNKERRVIRAKKTLISGAR